MGCGCKGRSTSVLPENSVTASTAPITSRVAVYEVVKDGEVVLSTTSATAARAEATRLNASIRVTSRAVTADDPVLV